MRREICYSRYWLPFFVWLLAAVLCHAQTKPASVPSLPPLVPAGIQAQAPRGELLPSERYRLHVDLPAVTHDLGAVQVPAPSRTIPLQVGINRRVALSPVEGGRRFRNPDGTQTTVFAIKSPGAVGVRVHFDRFKIPAGDEVYVRGLNAKRSSGGPYRENGTWNDGQFWSATVEGDTAVIEYQSRSSEGTFIVSEIAHIYRNVDAGMFTPDVLSCEVDASCSSVGPKNAVARIVFVDDGGGSYVCTGTLLNNSAGDRIPYFLTAAHCVSSQNEARSVQSYWLYQTTSCNSNSLRGDWVTTSQGGNLLATSSANDSTLIRLVDNAPSGVGFAGWNSTAQAVSTSVFGLHHPGGSSPPSLESYLRRSIGSVANTTASCSSSGLTNGYEINWSSGTTEPGSSGSGLFITSGSITYLVGALSCGSSTGACAGSFDLYGRFSSFYPQIASYLSPGPPLALGTAVDSPSLTWTTGGNGSWRGQTTTTHDGVDAAVSGTTSHSQESWMQTTMTGPGTLTFWWKVSSETGFDLLTFRLNGAEVATAPRISGEVNWQQKSINLPPGASTLRWTYSKDGSVDVGSDAGWVDQVTFSGGGGGSNREADVNGDGHADIVWQNLNTGARSVWLLQNGTYQSSRYLPSAAVPWRIGGTADFDADGHSDLAWENTQTGQRALWFLRNGVYQRSASLPNVFLAWSIAAAADFNADGHGDLAWQNTQTGARTIWLMRNGVRQSAVNLPNVALPWQIAAGADFDADGLGDLAWQNTQTGARVIWFLRNGVLQSTKTLQTVGTEWKIAAGADYNGDGHGDLIWQNTNTGERVIWFLQNGNLQLEQSLGIVAVPWDVAVH